MDVHVRGSTSGSATPTVEGEPGSGDVKKGQWTDEEDAVLMNYVRVHGEGRWNSVAHLAGLRRTGKSCRLRWLNYLRPDLRRGNITLEEQLTILNLHFQLGNRWSKIAKYLPGRTDNEIKNYWRTRVQKQAKQLKFDVNSEQFRHAMRYEWMPRMREQIRASSGPTTAQEPAQVPVVAHDSNSAIHPTVCSRTIQPGTSLGLTHELDSLIVMPEVSGSGMTSMDSSEGQLSPCSDLSDRTRVTGSNTDQAINRGDDIWSFDGGDQSFLWDDFWNEESIGLQLHDEDAGMNLLT